MFVYSLRGDKLKKLIPIVFAVIAVFVAVFIFVSHGNKNVTSSTKNGISLKAGDSEERIAFLSQFGWEVSNDPLEVSEIIIPYEFDETYEKYNELQSQQNFDLSKYKGVRVKRWTYEILNYPGYENFDGLIRANILVYDGKVIGGDVCNIELDGFMHTLAFPSNSETSTSENSDQTDSETEKNTDTSETTN